MKALVAVGAFGTFVPVAVVAVAGGVVGGSPSGSSPLTPRVALAYRQGARWCPGLPWEVLAAVGYEESKHGTHDGAVVDVRSGRVAHPEDDKGLFGRPLDGTGGTRRLPIGRWEGWHGLSGPWQRAVGPMQVLPGTFEAYGVDADGDGSADPHDFDDAAVSAARVLCGGRPTLGDLAVALRRYNDSASYVARVLAHAEALRPSARSPILCPVAGPTSFTDTWLAPRSGGRRHKGVDIFAPAGTTVVAPVGGQVRFDVDRLGGLAFHLWGRDGTYYYGAHLSRFGPRAGEVEAGAPLGAVGTTGNAVGTPPHLHFEIHPGRRPGDGPRPVNPTPATRAACGGGAS